jgi:anti-anti-sigma factor
VLTGEIDITCSPTLRSIGERLADALAAGDRLPVDVAEVTFIDSSGVGALVAVRNAASASGGSLVLRNLSQPVRRLLELSGLVSSFSIEEDDA